MPPRFVRLVYVLEFLVALIAIFSAWSEIGGQAVLDLMYWGWKLGLGAGLALAAVAYTAALVSEESWWTLRSARWLTTIVLLVLLMGVVTYFYTLEAEAIDTDDSGTVSLLCLPALALTPSS